MAQSATKVSRLEEEVAKLQKGIVDAGGPTLKRQQKACDRSKEKLNNANKDLNANKVSLKTSIKATEKANSARQTTQKELTKLTNKSDLLETKFAEMEANIQEVKEAYKKAKQVEHEKKQYITDIQRHNKEQTKTFSKIKCVEVDLMAKMEINERGINDYEKRFHHYDDEISKLVQAEEEHDGEFDVSDGEEEEEEE